MTSSFRRTDAQKRTFSLAEIVGNKIMGCVIKTAISVPKNPSTARLASGSDSAALRSALPSGFVF